MREIVVSEEALIHEGFDAGAIAGGEKEVPLGCLHVQHSSLLKSRGLTRLTAESMSRNLRRDSPSGCRLVFQAHENTHPMAYVHLHTNLPMAHFFLCELLQSERTTRKYIIFIGCGYGP